MDKKIAGLLGAAAALTAVTSAQAATSTTGLEPAANYRDLLEPIPNALARLQTEEGQGRAAPATGDTRLAQHLSLIHIYFLLPARREDRETDDALHRYGDRTSHLDSAEVL